MKIYKLELSRINIEVMSKSVNRYILVILLTTFIVASSFSQVDNYGADQANKRFVASNGMLGGRTDFDHLKLKNHPARSGVPMGGIGCGNIQFAPDGRFVRIGLNNIHLPVLESKAAFFSLWYKTKSTQRAVRLVRDQNIQYGMSGVTNIYYTGLFPRAEFSFDDEFNGITPIIKAWSGLIPHDVKNSSLPVVWFEVELSSKTDAEIAVSFSMDDFIGREIRDPKSLDGMEGQIFTYDRSNLVNGEAWGFMETPPTYAKPYKNSDYKGVMQYCKEPIQPLKATFQNYNDHICILAETNSGNSVSLLPSFDIMAGDANWKTFTENGTLVSESQEVSLSNMYRNGASAVVCKTKLKAGEKKTIRFMLVWFAPELKIDRTTASPGSYWEGGSDYGKYYHNYFSSIDDVVEYAQNQGQQILLKTTEWQKPVLESTMPDWYKFKLINSAYVIYTNMILNKKGDMTVNEGAMGGLAGTMDQRISSHPFYQKFFTQLDRSEMELFAYARQNEGNILHFIGHYYVGLCTKGGRVPTEGNWMLDNTAGWIIQLVKDYQQTADIDYLKRNIDRIKDGLRFLKRKIASEDIRIPIGATTYDDFRHPPIYSYMAGIYVATLHAAKIAAIAQGDEEWAKECEQQAARTASDMMKYLWNGRFFSYGCEKDGSGRADSILFTGQLAGPFINRYCGWGDIFPMEVTSASLVSQFKISIGSTPDYYANKVWDITKGHGIDMVGSQCWPFYLESYTAYPAIQAGYIEDAFEIMQGIQNVHLRRGWTWCQNLWNPGEITYMTAPVTWFSTDVLTGAALDIPNQTLKLGPVVRGKDKILLPVFFPTFWANVSIDPKVKSIKIKILKDFSKTPVTISHIAPQPIGYRVESGNGFDITPFKIEVGSELDLSPYYDLLISGVDKPSVLKNLTTTKFITVN